jgi:hypothetical protein
MAKSSFLSRRVKNQDLLLRKDKIGLVLFKARCRKGQDSNEKWKSSRNGALGLGRIIFFEWLQIIKLSLRFYTQFVSIKNTSKREDIFFNCSTLREINF